jgi:hypothetical protein
MSHRPAPLNRACEAVATFYPPDAPHVSSEALRGSCEWAARYWRDGRPVCGVHRRAKTVEFYKPWAQQGTEDIRLSWLK